MTIVFLSQDLAYGGNKMVSFVCVYVTYMHACMRACFVFSFLVVVIRNELKAEDVTIPSHK